MRIPLEVTTKWVSARTMCLTRASLPTGATAYATGEIAKVIAGAGGFSTTLNSVVRNTTLGVATTADTMWVVVMEDLDTVRLATW